MMTAAIYARVSSAQQREEQTIVSQTAALLEYAAAQGLEVRREWVFEDEGYSGATLVRPALEPLRDLAAQVGVDILLCYAPDRLARKYAYQALLIEEFACAGVTPLDVMGDRLVVGAAQLGRGTVAAGEVERFEYFHDLLVGLGHGAPPT
jgi:site-specific DNA recombinase